MSSTQARKPKSESYAYSWFLPASAHNGSATVLQAPPTEPLASASRGESSEMAARQARTEQWKHSGQAKGKSAAPKSMKFSPPTLRVAGVAGWSAIAGAGAVILATRSGPFPGVQMGILGGVWVGVSVLVWYFVGKL